MVVSNWLYLSVVERLVSLVLLKKSQSELEKEAQSASEILQKLKRWEVECMRFGGVPKVIVIGK